MNEVERAIKVVIGAADDFLAVSWKLAFLWYLKGLFTVICRGTRAPWWCQAIVDSRNEVGEQNASKPGYAISSSNASTISARQQYRVRRSPVNANLHRLMGSVIRYLQATAARTHTYGHPHTMYMHYPYHNWKLETECPAGSLSTM